MATRQSRRQIERAAANRNNDIPTNNNVNPYRNPVRPPDSRQSRPPLSNVNLPSQNRRRLPLRQQGQEAPEQSK